MTSAAVDFKISSLPLKEGGASSSLRLIDALDPIPPYGDRLDVLRACINEGYSFDPNARDDGGCNEFMVIARYCGLKGVQLFLDHGGQFSNGVLDDMGQSEYIWLLASLNALEDSSDLEKLFFCRGGTVNPEAKAHAYTGYTDEWIYTARRLGAAGLELYYNYGGRPRSGVIDDSVLGCVTQTYCITRTSGAEALGKHFDLGGQCDPAFGGGLERRAAMAAGGKPGVDLYDRYARQQATDKLKVMVI